MSSMSGVHADRSGRSYEGRKGQRRPPGHASPAEVAALANLYREQYRHWNARHFYEQYRDVHGGVRSYKWVCKRLQEAGLVPKSHVNGRRRRNTPRPRPLERQAQAGALLHQAGRSDEWVSGRRWDLTVMIDDATNGICAGVFAEEPGFWPRINAVRETVEQIGLFDRLASARSPRDWELATGYRAKRRHRIQFGRVMDELGIEVIPSSSPQALGRSGRLLRTLKDRLGNELTSADISEIAEANAFLRGYWPRFNAVFAVEPRDEGGGFDPLVADLKRSLDEVFCLKETVTIGPGDHVAYRGRVLQIPADVRGCNSGAEAEVREYADGSLAVYRGRRNLGTFDRCGRLLETRPS